MEKTKFEKGWYVSGLPIYPKVAVIDNSEEAKIGLSAMQIHALDNPSSVTLEFVGKQIKTNTWNAMGMACTREANDIRITQPIADKLKCKIGDTIAIVSKDMILKPVDV